MTRALQPQAPRSCPPSSARSCSARHPPTASLSMLPPLRRAAGPLQPQVLLQLAALRPENRLQELAAPPYASCSSKLRPTPAAAAQGSVAPACLRLQRRPRPLRHTLVCQLPGCCPTASAPLPAEVHGAPHALWLTSAMGVAARARAPDRPRGAQPHAASLRPSRLFCGRKRRPRLCPAGRCACGSHACPVARRGQRKGPQARPPGLCSCSRRPLAGTASTSARTRPNPPHTSTRPRRS
mmetsp:Transcript_59928/g.192942  ORF Transcript_59928/g.192942 Transcript_59928/m.192942 type:complete len:239 (-) Transcript_59928:592-1308(-)